MTSALRPTARNIVNPTLQGIRIRIHAAMQQLPVISWDHSICGAGQAEIVVVWGKGVVEFWEWGRGGCFQGSVIDDWEGVIRVVASICDPPPLPLNTTTPMPPTPLKVTENPTWAWESGKMGESGRNRETRNSGCNFLPFPCAPRSISTYNLCLSSTNTTEHPHEYDGVKYVPVKALQDPNRKWISAGWLSKHVKHCETGPKELGLTTGSGEGGRSGRLRKD